MFSSPARGYRACVTDDLLNPAGRLHRAFVAYDESPQHTGSQRWSDALEVAPTRILVPLGALISQVGLLRSWLTEHAPSQVETLDEYEELMMSPMLGASTGLMSGARAEELPRYVLRWLSTTSLLLNATMSLYATTSPEDRMTLIEVFEDARVAVREDTSIDAQTKGHLLRLLQEGISVLDTFYLYGPEALVAITDQIGVAGTRGTRPEKGDEEKDRKNKDTVHGALMNLCQAVYTKAVVLKTVHETAEWGVESASQLAQITGSSD